LAVAKSQPDSAADAALAAAYYGTSHPYGRLFPTEAQLNGYTLQDLRGFHARISVQSGPASTLRAGSTRRR
jgi:predicted Zn-dependent peptidase